MLLTLYKKSMKNFIDTYTVSRETYQKLEQLVALLNEWQAKFNLVSNNSLPDVWQRHIADSAQLFKYLNNQVDSVYDVGSGAGFPALVLAVMAQEQYPRLKFTLIESITKKTLYLNAVKTVLNLNNVTILNKRTEDLKLPPADVITARAVASLDKLLGYVFKFTTRQTKLIFPKGKSYREELDAAAKMWNFKLEVCKNETSEDGVVLLLENLRRKSK